MSKKNGLRDVAVKIGSTLGKADAKAHNAARKAATAAHVAKEELVHLKKHVDALKRQLDKSTNRLKSALK